MSENTMTRTPHLTRAATAEALSDAPGSVITLLADSDTTGGALTCNTAAFEEGAAGAPAHFHTRATEFFHVLSGSLDVLVGTEVKVLGEGDFLVVPPGVPHAFAPTAGHTAEVFVGFTPGMDRFDYYRLLGRVRSGEATLQDVRDSAEQYDNHYLVDTAGAAAAAWRDRRRSAAA